MAELLAIDGIGAVGAFGCGREALLRAAEAGHAPVTSAPAGTGGDTAPAYGADDTALKEFISGRAIRRIDRYSRLALLGAALALRDAGIHMDETGDDRLGVVVTTGYGPVSTTVEFLDSMAADGETYASPTAFSSSVHNAAAAAIAMKLGARGPAVSIAQLHLPVVTALQQARLLLAQGHVDRVLVGAVEEYHPVVGCAYAQEFAPTAAGLQPLAFTEQTAIPGEGAAFFLLSRGGTSRARAAILAIDEGAQPPLQLAEGGLVRVAADGCRARGLAFARALPPRCDAAAAAAVYGSMPTGLAFELALAAQGVGAADDAALQCVSVAADGGWGVVRTAVSP